MNESLSGGLLYLGIALYVLYLYRYDMLAARSGQPNPKALPGATQASIGLCMIGLVGALIILALETSGEWVIGITDQQSDLPWTFLFASLAAGVIEEVIFRGFLVVENRGRELLIVSCAGFSILFVLLHPYLWKLDYPDEVAMWQFWLADFGLVLTPKTLFTSIVLFVNSLWLYAVRFGAWNPKRSLIPCMLTHSVSNLGVFFVKWLQGHVVF